MTNIETIDYQLQNQIYQTIITKDFYLSSKSNNPKYHKYEEKQLNWREPLHLGMCEKCGILSTLKLTALVNINNKIIYLCEDCI